MFPLYVPNNNRICNFFAEGKTPFDRAQQLYYCNIAQDTPTNPVTPSMILKTIKNTGSDINNPASRVKYDKYARTHQYMDMAYIPQICYSCTLNDNEFSEGFNMSGMQDQL